MRKLKGILALIVTLLMATSCSLLGGPSVEKAEDLFDNDKYDDGVEMLEEILDENDMNFDAWFALIEGQLDEDEYDDADDSLEELFEIIEDNYDEDDDEIDYEEVVEDFIDAAEDLMKEEEPGDWYNSLVMPYVDAYYLSWETFSTGDVIELDYDMMYIPEGTTLLYNLDGDKVKANDDEYKGQIQLPNEEGEFELAIAPINALGMVGETTYTIITIAELMAAPEVDLAPGYHEGPVEIHILNFQEDDDLSYQYTLDGSDPKEDYEWIRDNMIPLEGGEFTLRMVIYNYNTGLYSEELVVDYEIENMLVVNNPTTLTIGVLKADYDLYDDLYWMFDDIMSLEPNLTLELIEYTDTETQYNDFANGVVDALFSWNGNIAFYYDYLADVSSVLKLEEKDFFPGVEEGITIDGEILMVPLVAAPSHLLMNNWELDTDELMDVTSIEELSEYFTYDGYSDHGMAFLYTEPKNFFPIYHGFGGETVVTEMGTVSLSYDAVVSSLMYIEDIIFTYGASTDAVDYEEYMAMIEAGNSYLIFDGPWLFANDDYRWNYSPVGNMPLNEGQETVPWLYVDGLFINNSVEGDKTKSAALRVLYNYLGTDYDYNYFYSDIANAMNGLPADRNLIGEYYYSYYMDDTLEFMQITETSLAYSPFVELQINYVYDELDGYIFGYLNGDISIDEAANGIISAMATE